MQKEQQAVKDHFNNRANKYNRSSSWVNDQNLIDLIYKLSGANVDSEVLDLATGTGKVAERFFGNVKNIVGVDMCEQMLNHAAGRMDSIVISQIENLGFDENTFNACVCRQGLQFTSLSKSIPEAYRVLKPGGSIVLSHLTSYPNASGKDIFTTFRIQALRNPARKNYFLYGDIQNSLLKAGFKNLEVINYVTTESINTWIDNGAISEENKQQIREIYRNAEAAYKTLHNVKFTPEDIFDDMMMVVVKAEK